MSESLVIRPAVAADAVAIAALVNRAYRGESSRAGWTTEADLLEGVRTLPAQVHDLIAQAGVLLFTGWLHGQLVGTLCAEWHAQHSMVHLGMIAVEPTLQNRGIGKLLIQWAEQRAVQQWGARFAQMAVIGVRAELIAFYQRLGYLPTGETRDFPLQPDMWQPKVDALQLRVLQKQLC
jgi:GNAT superfamily N-acetyltransferase